MNRLFVAYKPSGVVSNHFLSRLKRKYGVKKAGFSGTLDPFAKGVLIIGFGSYTKLFRFLDKTPKRYRATLWLGLDSLSLDTENVQKVQKISEFPLEKVKEALFTCKGKLTYTPPIFSAKSIDGQRAYDLAREGKEVKLKEVTSTIYDVQLCHYRHPFVTFEVTVSEGTYVRSIGDMVAKKLGTFGSLSALERLCEGKFIYEDEKPLEIKKYLSLKENFYLGDAENIRFGRKLALEDFKIQDEGTYFLDNENFITIITIKENKVKYELGRIEC
ncbi:MAG: tRNA pseudouridine(55) synthase TruB [Epsilonproteobacteria bacterium]|nr:tRNA pseudouridine(55) synthase TruB [Campylobacterota bacterium]